MCGIVAVLRLDGGEVEAETLSRMRDAMVHRGPDDAGLYLDGEVGLGHRRLSIVDLSPAGHQPIGNEDGRLWMVFNGEIYNHVELRAELRRRGHRFSSQTDGEVILHLFEEEGERCVERLNGMFAFVIWDTRRRRLFGARDRLGIKPLHYHRDGERFICASEVKAILADPSVPRVPDHSALADYLFCSFPLGGRTMFQGIHQLPPGHTLSVDRGGVRVRPYWDLEYRYDFGRSDVRLASELSELLDDAVRIHCRSDAPVGCHLSGGLDSSVVTSLAARHRHPLKTFSIRFREGGCFDETPFARAVARHAGARYLEASPSAEDFRAVFPSLVWHMEMPLPNVGGFSYYTVSRLAARHVKVSLTGHGGDEVFAGYPAQFQAAFGTTAPFGTGGKPPGSPREGWPARLRRVLRSGGVRSVLGKVRSRLRSSPPTLEDRWVSLHCGRLPAENPLFDRGFVRSLGGYDPTPGYLAHFTGAPTDEVLDRCLYHDLRCYLPGLLYMEDRVSMAVSLESRVPLLDHRIAELMATVPPGQKVRGLRPKALLREAGSRVLPAEVRERSDKRPFPVPLEDWFTGGLAGYVAEVLLSPASLDRGVFDPDWLRRGEWRPGELWAALNVELWHRTFIDRHPAPVAPAHTLPGAAAPVPAAL